MTGLTYRWPLVVIGMLVLASVVAPTPAEAQRERDEEATETPTIDASTGKVLNEAIEALNMEDYPAAEAAIATLNFERLSPYERSRVEQILAGIAHYQEDYGRAQTHLRNAVEAGGLNAQETSQARYQIAQIYMLQENWAEGVTALEEWFETAENPNSGAYYLLAVAYYQQDDLERALAPAERAIELADRPQESWLQLVLALRMQRERYADSVPVLEQLIALRPNSRSYWLQLSSVYGQLDDYARALAVMQLAHTAGAATEDADLRRLTDLLLFNGVPHRGAQLMQASIASNAVARDSQAYEKLANCWIAAGEYDNATEPLQLAAELAANGDLFVRLGEVHIQREQWADAAMALQQGIEKGDLRSRGNAELLMGIALLNQERYDDARGWLQRATSAPEQRDAARAYLQYIDAQGGRS
jgi:tetratricopeptide (TPR) repeat protein